MRKRNKKTRSSCEPQKSVSLTLEQQQSKCYEGEHLDRLLKPIGRVWLNCWILQLDIRRWTWRMSIVFRFSARFAQRMNKLLSAGSNVTLCTGEIELEKLSKGALPEKIWIKQRFSIGVNDVTRVLERMMPSSRLGISAQRPPVAYNCRNPSVQLQAVLLASDCNPRWLTKHLPSLASSREVPLIFVKDNRGGSLRLGELVKLKTAIAIGVKARGSGINKILGRILNDDQTVEDN